MDRSALLFRIAFCFLALIVMATFLGVSGCTRTEVRRPDLGTHDAAWIALSKIPQSALTHCDTQLGPVPANTTGNLLDDFNTLATKGAACAEKNDRLVNYLLDTLHTLGIRPPPTPAPKLPDGPAAVLSPHRRE